MTTHLHQFIIKTALVILGVFAPLFITGAAFAKESEHVAKTTALFAGIVPTLNLRLDPKAMEQLRKDPRSYIEASIEEAGGKIYGHLAIKLKGSAGSFQGIDARPGFSINCSKFKGGDRFHGLKRFQLNNCAQDGTALNEMMSGEIARAAGVPASRCTHALVSLNGKDLGIYVLKEGFTEDFLAPFFKRTDGQLYDGGFCAEVHEKMEMDHGDESRREGLLKLSNALKEPDAAKRAALLSAVVDVDAHLRFVALENILCHWDGYSFNRNNYRIYEDPAMGRFHFILHGMDQMFGDPGQNLQRTPGSSVGSTLWQIPANQERYHAVLTEIYEKVLKPTDWSARVEERGKKLMAALKPEQAKQYEPRVAEARGRIAERLKQVRMQIEAPHVINTLATKGKVELKDGAWAAQVDNGESKEVTEDGRPCLYLKAKDGANASWRMSIEVPAGMFRFEARVKTRGVVPVMAETGEGAGLRISGGTRKGIKSLKGDAAWETLSYDIFSQGRGCTLVAELRASAGEMWIDRETLRVVRVP